VPSVVRRPEAYQPQHWAELNLLQGVPYYFFPGPTFAQYLADNNVKMALALALARVRSVRIRDSPRFPPVNVSVTESQYRKRRCAGECTGGLPRGYMRARQPR